MSDKRVSIVPCYTWWYVINGDDVHEVRTHAEALSLRESILRDQEHEQWEGGIDYEVVEDYEPLQIRSEWS